MEMTISIPAASAACRAAQFRGLIFGPVEGMRVPSISIAISWMLTPLFYLFFARLPGVSRNGKPLRYHRFMPSIAYLECSRCPAQISAESPQTVCPQCGGALLVRYDMAAIRRSMSRESKVPLPRQSQASDIGKLDRRQICLELGTGWTKLSPASLLARSMSPLRGCEILFVIPVAYATG